MADIQTLLSVLDVFSRAPDKASLGNANAWLQEFQHSPEAWSTCNVLLLSPEAPPAAKLFAAQTFRTKVTYDLNQVDANNVVALRDTLVTALQRYHTGPRTIIIQLCLALSGLALQLPAWTNPVESMVELLGQDPMMVPALLHFLTVLPEEVNTNTRIPVTDKEYQERSYTILTMNSKAVLDLLSMYIQAQGVTSSIQAQVFNCLRSWLVAGEINVTALAQTPLLGYAFDALASEELFDSAVDVICDLIHETQEVDENMPVIELIVPRVIALRPKLAECMDDPDKVKGYARIFTEAGETYRLLLLQNPEPFFPIVEAIGECSANPDLDIVPVTFHFWMRLAQSIGKKPSVSPLFLDAYKALMSVIIRHLHFPPDDNALTGQEADNFRGFRHVMGDTLKDCCYVLGTNTCLIMAYEIIRGALSRGGNVTWQEIEAPLFSMRSMGAELDPTDDTVVPKIMDLIPSLPNHPRIRYAALLIISRYTEWVSLHSDYIQFQLQYISAGFEDSNEEVVAAAGQALKYLCQDCKQHLIEFLPQLHAFLNSQGAKLAQEDKIMVYEAIAYVISAMPMDQAAQWLRTFSMDILAKIHALATQVGVATKQQLQEICNGLENLEVMLHVIKTFGDELPSSCQNTCQEVWSLFDPFLAKYASDYDVTEHSTRVLRHGLEFFGAAVLPIATSVLTRLSAAFSATGYPSYLWIAGKLIGRFGNEEDPVLRNAYRDAYEIATSKVVSLLQQKAPRDVPDVLEDYVRMLLEMIKYIPDILFQSSAFPLAFRVAMVSLTLVHTDITFAALDFIRSVLTHDCLMPNASSTPPPPKFPIYASIIGPVIEKEGLELVVALLTGLVGDFPEDSVSMVVTIFRQLAGLWPSELLSWLPPVLQQLPSATAPAASKAQFLEDVTSAINTKAPDKVKYAVLSLHRASCRARDRRRAGPLDQ